MNLHGSTELGAVAVGSPDDPADRRRKFVGPLLPGVSLSKRRGQQAGELSLLWFDHLYGFECYVDVNGSSKAEHGGRPDPVMPFCSSDIGRLDDGYLEVIGREDDQVKRDGLFVACSAVAAALSALQGIKEVAVLAGNMGRRGRSLLAFCVPEAAAEWAPKELRRACFNVLPSHAVPDQVFILAKMPTLQTGKVDREELRCLSLPASRLPKSMPPDDQLRAIIAELKQLIAGLDAQLPADPIEDTTLLFEGGLGLDSFAVLELIISVEESFGIEFDKSDLVPDSFRSLYTLSTVIAENLARLR